MSKFRIPPITAACLLLGVMAAAARAQAPAQPPAPQAPQQQAVKPPPVPPRPDAGPGHRVPAERSPEQTLQGTVRSYLLTPAGDVNGLLLEDGTQVDVPPHLSARLTDGVHVRDRVEVTGVRAPGGSLVRASQIRDQATAAVVRVDGPPQATPPAHAAAAPALAPMTANGRVAALLYTPRGDVGGVLTQDGTQVRFPPQGDAQRGLAVGQPIYARGFGTAGPHGRAMEATAVGPNETDAKDVFRPPAARPAPPPAPVGVGPDAGPQRRADAGPAGAQPPALPTPPRPAEPTAH